MNRINVVGTSGSGKSTFARSLAQRLGYRYTEMDTLYWGPQWTPQPESTFLENLTKTVAAEQWVLDGNYDQTLSIKWSRATHVIWLDYSFAHVWYRAMKRALYRAISRREIWAGTGNRESFRQSFFSRDSILLWTLKTYARNRVRYAARMVAPEYAHIQFVRLRSPREAERFLLQVPTSVVK